MKKTFLLCIMMVVFTSTAFAADKEGDSCPSTGYLTSQVGGEVLSCINGKWKLTGHVGTTQVTLTVQLMEGDKLQTSTSVTTLDGQPVPISIGTERAYVAEAKKEGDKVILTPGIVKSGFFMTMTPTLAKDGKIEVEFVVSKSELTAINKFKQGDMEIELPQVSSVDLKQKVALDSGKEITIPFGPLVEPMQSGKPAHAKYTLKLVATKS